MDLASDMEMQISRIIGCFAMLFVLGVVVGRPALAQDWSLPPLPAKRHAFDYLLGKWNFSQEGHIPQFKAKGTGTFSRMGDGFTIFDEYRDNGAGGTRFLGETYRAYNPDKSSWTLKPRNMRLPRSV
ncbi:MAG: hypothetical protein JO159_07195 [Acidobacteria bacterium]|nr:hypothetical protein [Acidobacteriota bacterium]